MAINITTLIPTSIKAKNVATEEYVDTFSLLYNCGI